MPDKEICIEINTTATGDGAKQTSDDLVKLRKGSDAAAKTAQDLRAEMAKTDQISESLAKELNKTADALDEVANRGNQAIERIKTLGAQEDKTAAKNKDLSNGIFDAARKIEDQADASDELTRSLKSLSTQQKAANNAADRAAPATQKAAKGKRNLGLAALEASRGLEDLQFGIHGAINNIPGLILMLGGTAGLTAVISVLAVSMAVLSKHVGDNSAALAANAEIADVSSKRKLEASRAARAQSEELASQTAISAQILASETSVIGANISAIEAQSAARQRSFAVTQQINNETLARDIALVSGDASLSELQKVQAVIALKRDADAAAQRAVQDKLSADLAAEQQKLQRADTIGAQLIEHRIERQRELTEEIERSKRNLEDLNLAAERSREQLTSSAVPELDKVLSTSSTEATLKNPLRLINAITPGKSVGSPDRSDFDTDEAFLKGSRSFFDRDEASSTTRRAAQPLLESAELLQSQILASEKLAAAEEKRISVLQKQKAELVGQREEAEKIRNSEIESAQQKIELLKEEASQELAINQARAERIAAEDTNAERSAANTEISKQVSQLGSDIQSDLESTQATAAEIEAAKQAVSQIQATISGSLRDTVITAEESAKIGPELGNLSRLLSAGNSATMTNIAELTAALEANIRATNNIGAQIRNVQNQIQSR